MLSLCWSTNAHTDLSSAASSVGEMGSQDTQQGGARWDVSNVPHALIKKMRNCIDLTAKSVSKAGLWGNPVQRAWEIKTNIQKNESVSHLFECKYFRMIQNCKRRLTKTFGVISDALWDLRFSRRWLRCVLTKYNLARVRRFDRTYYLHLQSRRINQEEGSKEKFDNLTRLNVCFCWFLAWFADRTWRWRNVGKHQVDYTTLQPTRLALFIWVVKTVKASDLAHEACILSDWFVYTTVLR